MIPAVFHGVTYWTILLTLLAELSHIILQVGWSDILLQRTSGIGEGYELIIHAHDLERKIHCHCSVFGGTHN